MNIQTETIFSWHDKLVKKEISAVEILTLYKKQIEKLDKEIQAFLTLDFEHALQQAKNIDEQIKQKQEISLLAGLPVGVKDVLMTKGLRTTAGSKILDKYQAVYDATVVSRLKNQGMVMIGKNNCDEFAMGSSTENSAFYPTKNPYDLTRVPGGSSGGSAAAVAASEVVYSLGTDTGGSIRQPAAFCGVVGLKPTYGLVSRYGLIAMASSLDCIGPFTKTVAESAAVLSIIAGHDANDATTQDKKVKNYHAELSANVKGLKVGLPQEYFIKGLDEKIKSIIMKLVRQLANQGAEIIDVSLPLTEYALPVYYIIMPAEVSSNLAKFDGLRFGSRGKEQKNLFAYYAHTRGQGFGAEVRRRILIGTYVLSAGYVDDYYLQAQKVRTKIYQDFARVFSTVDVLLTPTTPTIPFKLGDKISDPLQMYLSDIYTVSANLAGLPGLSVPAGMVENLPVGVQLIGPRFSESTLFNIGLVIEELREPINPPNL